MKFPRLVALLAALSLSLGVVGGVAASTTEQCQSQLTTLRADTVASQSSFANPKDVDGLVAKLDAAAAKLQVEKNTDAVHKLVDFQTTLNALASSPKPKVDAEVAQRLVQEAQAVIDCINAVGSEYCRERSLA